MPHRRSGRNHASGRGSCRQPQDRVRLGLFSAPAAAGKAPSINVAAEMIYWERPGGGRVFHAGSINAGSTLSLNEKWAGLMRNVLDHFGVRQS